MPALADMFLATSTNYAAFCEPFYWEYKDRFIPIFDKSVSMSSDYGGSGVGNDANYLIDFSADVDIPTYYSGNLGTYADILRNTLWCFWIGNASVGSVNAPDVNNWCRVLYTDS